MEKKITIPILNLETYAKEGEDEKVAIVEAVLGFCIAAERFGKGVEEEIKECFRSSEAEQGFVKPKVKIS